MDGKKIDDFLTMEQGEIEAVISLYIHRELADGVSAYHVAERFRGMVAEAVDVQLRAEYRATDIEIELIESGKGPTENV